jgi:uncharacterized RDD family membrane protein YckC
MSTGLAPVATPPPASLPGIVPAPPLPYGGFWIRVVASLVDDVIRSAVFIPLFVVLLLPAFRTMSQRDWDEKDLAPLLATLLLTLALGVVGAWLYEALLTSSSWQGTVGKRLLSLRVTDLEGNRISFARSTGRFFAKFLSRMIWHIGFIIVAFTQRKQGLHDFLAGTLVKKE